MLAGIVALWASIFLVGVGLLRQARRPDQGRRRQLQRRGGVQDVPLAAVAGAALGKVTAAVDRRRAWPGSPSRRTGSRPAASDELTGSAGTAEDGTYTLAGLLPGHVQAALHRRGLRRAVVPGGRRRRPRPRRSSSSRPARSTDLDVAMVGQPGRDRSASVDAARRAPTPGQPITVTVTGGRRAADATRDAPGAAAAAAGRSQETTGAGVVRRPRHARRRTASASRPRASSPRSSTRRSAAAQTSVLNTVRLGAADGQHRRHRPLERRRPARQRRRSRSRAATSRRRRRRRRPATSARSSSTASRRRARTS